MDSQQLDPGRQLLSGDDGADGPPPPPCPRFATRDEWEAWHGALTWEQQLRRADLDPPEHEYTEADLAKARAREEHRREQCWNPDPFSYADDRRDGPWPRVDQLEVPALSNTWRMDPACGYSPGGFAVRTQRASHRDLIDERLPARARRDPEVRLAWLNESIEQEEASLRAALKGVLRERHGRLSPDGADVTVSTVDCAMAGLDLVRTGGLCRRRLGAAAGATW